jgi:hypothetical protein
MQEEFSRLLGRKVDLVNRRAIEQSANWLRRRSILENAHVRSAGTDPGDPTSLSGKAADRGHLTHFN